MTQSSYVLGEIRYVKHNRVFECLICCSQQPSTVVQSCNLWLAYGFIPLSHIADSAILQLQSVIILTLDIEIPLYYRYVDDIILGILLYNIYYTFEHFKQIF